LGSAAFGDFEVGGEFFDCYRYDVAVILMSGGICRSCYDSKGWLIGLCDQAGVFRDEESDSREGVMLVLSRKTSERILIGDDIAVTIVRIGPNSVRIGIEAPKSMNIVREELCHFSEPKDEHRPDVIIQAN
jgi:carbon storage regulator